MSTNRPGVLVATALVLTLLAPSSPAQQGPDVTCAACILVDDTGTVLFARNATSRLPNASTTKMVTALVVRERTELGEDVVISDTAAAAGAALLNLPSGGGYTVKELLHALLLASSNEAAVALAEHVAGSEGAFVELMTRYARRLGLEGTAFITSHGLDRPGHHSTASDLALIGAELLEDPVLAKIVAESQATISGPRGPIRLDNRNLLLDSYRGAIGIKTGYTARAGNVLVAGARRHGRTLVAVALRSVDATADAAALLDHGFTRLRRTVIVPAARKLGAVVFEQAGSTGVIAARTIRGLARPSQIDVIFVPRADLTLPVEAGEDVGVLEITTRSGRLLATVDAIAERAVAAHEPSLVERGVAGLLRGVASLFGGA